MHAEDESIAMHSLVFPWPKDEAPCADVWARLLIVTMMAWLGGNAVRWRRLESATSYAIGVDWMESWVPDAQ